MGTQQIWRKSSHTGNENNCVELAWRKASRTEGNNNCVEVAHVPGVAAVRDSKNPSGPVLSFTQAELVGFLSAVKAHRFDG
ncbi:DUF397 domain-containing protein [Solihabitans fulvus]|uniref:DUF397 domain-containing protein n=1 Tax=Solihabitans fulvus TaxID=1892852 RepID=A0A5B2X6F4_9PSEU|nr:DUF397 domain-containing protein [Solihabitans fulvus]KAA2258813.1 DUF397 domain-containing protein [Solihabitans fulvus]